MVTVNLTITLTEQPNGTDQDDAMFGTVDINGIPHHITLIEVMQDEEGNQEGLTSWGDNCLAAMRQFESVDDSFHTISVGNKQYVLCVTPYVR